MAAYALYTGKNRDSGAVFLLKKDDAIYSCRQEDCIYPIEKFQEFYGLLTYDESDSLDNYKSVKKVNDWVDE